MRGGPLVEPARSRARAEVKALVKRYLEQMIGELQDLPHPDGAPGSLVDAIDLIIPHQANKRMVIDLAEQAGIGRDRMYFNIARVGNTSAASIPPAIHDAGPRGRAFNADPRVHARLRAGAVAGYAVLLSSWPPPRPGPSSRRSGRGRRWRWTPARCRCRPTPPRPPPTWKPPSAADPPRCRGGPAGT